MYEQIAREFETQNAGVSIELVGYNDYEDLLQATLRASITGSVPDVSHQGMGFIPVLYEQEIARRLDGFIAQEEDWAGQGYLESLEEVCRHDGGVYCLPFSVSVPVLFYNADLIAAAGSDPASFPTTWSEVIELADRIHHGDASAVGIYYDHDSDYMFQAIMGSFGSPFMEGDRVGFGGPQGMRAYEVLGDIAETGDAYMSREQARQAFIGGKIGIFANSSSILGSFTDQIGSAFELGVAPFPLEVDDGRVPAGGNAVVVLTNDPSKQTAAWNYVKFATGPRAQTIMATTTGYAPVNTHAVDGEEYLKQYYLENPNAKVAPSQLPYLTAWFSFPGPDAIRLTKVISDSMADVLSGRTGSSEALSALVQDAQTLVQAN
ncbi:extracellular solute-binding protein (plasmid) [Sinorhizobium medicae]|uniref:extracellular solute-binding protein n=1 Tax=Sinorhizobium medicae TaxID=110321 RepID=UPI002AF6BC09|nr:extracellular solute-binding protein [Sinorhizobium medicae]WQO62270.1 extracellular solute-binding protein [Sinorhizobium medicae]